MPQIQEGQSGGGAKIDPHLHAGVLPLKQALMLVSVGFSRSLLCFRPKRGREIELRRHFRSILRKEKGKSEPCCHLSAGTAVTTAAHLTDRRGVRQKTPLITD